MMTILHRPCRPVNGIVIFYNYPGKTRKFLLTIDIDPDIIAEESVDSCGRYAAAPGGVRDFKKGGTRAPDTTFLALSPWGRRRKRLLVRFCEEEK